MHSSLDWDSHMDNDGLSTSFGKSVSFRMNPRHVFVHAAPSRLKMPRVTRVEAAPFNKYQFPAGQGRESKERILWHIHSEYQDEDPSSLI